KSAIVHNLKIFKKIIGPKVRLMAVIKSNAYGHGALEVAKICQMAKEVDWLAAVNLEEALELRSAKITKPILVLSYYDLDKNQVRQAIKRNISLVVYQQRQFEFLNRIAGNLKKKALVQFKVDTGTSRLGVPIKDAFQCINTLMRYKNLKLSGLFTHYASAEAVNQSFTKEQTKQFYQLIQKLEQENIFIPLKHVACSAAALMDKNYHFDAIRLGISLYGLWSLEDGQNLRKKYQLQPALTWKTKVIEVKELSAGATIGYGQTYKAKRKIKIAVLPVGYWEGYDRRLSNRGEVLMLGQRCPIRGRVCMNLMMVDITGRNVKVGDEAVLIGVQGREVITADELSKKIGTINYEVVTRINSNILRRLI
ncbi:MAG: alanine racemase, partial [Candidatus Magasanikbacteria bacterium]|nr:alanine racemase [Candidatus Magasanikbacteria bacterium]